MSRIFRCAVCLMVLACSAQGVWAGSLKSRIQTQLEKESNIQYEPYYLESSYEVQRADTVQTQNVRGGYQTSTSNLPVSRQTAANLEMPQEAMTAPAAVAPAKEPADPLSNYIIYNMKYDAELDENVVTVKGRVVFEVLQKNGWTRVPLVDTSVGLIDVRVNKGTSYVTRMGNRYYLIVNKPGRYTLDLEFLIKAKRERENGPGSFSVDVLPAPISQFEFVMPEKDVQIFVEPAIKVEIERGENRTSAWAVMPNTSRIDVRWTKALPKEEIVSVELEPKLYVQTETQASVGGGVVSCRSQLNYSILQSEVSSLRVAFPDGVSILDVKGRELRDWKVSSKDKVQYLDVFLNYGTKGKYQLDVSFEQGIGEGSGIVQIPWIRAMGVERETGYLGIAATTNVELKTKELGQVTPIDTKQLPSGIWTRSSNPILLAFKYVKQPAEVTIEMTRHEEIPVLIAAVDHAEYTTLRTKEGKILTKAVYQVRNNVKQFLRLQIPKEARIWSSFVAGKPVKPAKDRKGNVLIPLEKSQLQGESLTRFPVEIVYLDEGKGLRLFGQMKMTLPAADVPISELTWSMFLPYDDTYFNFGGDVRYVKSFRHGPGFGQTIVDSLGGSYARRGVQGRLKSASDDIGDQYWGDAGRSQANGVLPIKIDIPQQGKQLRFSKLLVVEGESPYVTIRYTGLLAKFTKPLKVLFWLIVVFLLLRLICRWRGRCKRKKEQRNAEKA